MRAAANRRAGMSADPPAPKGTTIVIGWEGQASAMAARGTKTMSAEASAHELNLLGTDSSTAYMDADVSGAAARICRAVISAGRE